MVGTTNRLEGRDNSLIIVRANIFYQNHQRKGTDSPIIVSKSELALHSSHDKTSLLLAHELVHIVRPPGTVLR